MDRGTTGRGEIVIDYGVPIENSGTVSGVPAESIEETDLASGILTVRIPEGINTGEIITLRGVRFDMAASDAERVVCEPEGCAGVRIRLPGGASFC